MIKRLHHTGFVVQDLESTLGFYRDVVGLEVQRQYERKGTGIDQVIGYEDAHLKIALLGVTGHDHILELIQYVNPPPKPRGTVERSVLGGSHLSFLVNDIQATFAKLSKNGGAQIMNPPADVAPGRTACYLQDPEGNWVELMQLAEE